MSGGDARAGGRQVVEAAWHQLSADLYRFIPARVATSHDAEDVLQLVFLRLTGQPQRLRDDERVAAWLYATTRNAITDHYRSAPRSVSVLSTQLPTWR